MATRPFDPVELTRDTGTIADTVEEFPEFTPSRTAGDDSFTPERGFWEDFGVNYSPGRVENRVDRTDFQTQMLAEGYAPILDALGLPPSQSPAGFHTIEGSRNPILKGSDLLRMRGKSPMSSMTDRATQEQLIADEIRERRRTDPEFLEGVPDTVKGLREYFLEQQKGKRAEAGRVTPHNWGGTFGRLVGSFVELGSDPANVAASIALAPLGAGGTLVRTFGRELLINSAVEAALQAEPLVGQHLEGVVTNRELIGEELGVGEAISNVVISGVAGASLSTAIVGLGRLGAKAPNAYDRAAEAVFKAMPESVQKRWAGKAKAGEVPLSDLFADVDNFELGAFAESMIGRDKMTPEEAAAVNVLRRDQEVGEASPFEAGPDGDAAHEQSLAKAIQAILDGPRPSSSLGTGPRPAAGPLLSSTALTRPFVAGPSTPTVAGGRTQFEARVRGVESGGNDAARNRRSSAAGRYQFTDDTWARYHRRIYGGDGLADKFNPAKQDRLFAALTDDNEQALRAFGIQLSAGNYYLAHVAGAGGAAKLHRAAPGASAQSVLGAKVIEVNPFLAKMTARDVIEWAHGKMGGGSPPPSSVVAAGLDGEDPAIAALRAEADAAEAEALVLSRSAEDTGLEPVPVLKRELFDSDEAWADAQVSVYRALNDDQAEMRPLAAAEGPPVRETGGALPRQPEVQRPPEQPDYQLGEARYAKGKMLLRPISDGSGFKGSADRLAEALGGRWTGRSSGYVLSQAAAAKFEKLHAAGFTADIRMFSDQPVTLRHGAADRRGLTVTEALKEAEARLAPPPLTRAELDAMLPGGRYLPGERRDALWLAGLDSIDSVAPRPIWAVRDNRTGAIVTWSVSKKAAAKARTNAWDPDQRALEKLTPDAIAAELRARAADRAAIGAAAEVKLDDPAMTGFDAPKGPGRQAQAESLEHDLRMDAEAAARGDPFAPEHPEIAGDWEAVVMRLAADRRGSVPGAIEHPEVGPIDVVWGRPASGDSQGFGLAHIIDDHPEVDIATLPELIASMTVARRYRDRINLETPDHRAAVRLDWDGRSKRWLVTAFGKGGGAPPPADVTRASGAGQDGSPGLGADDDIRAAIDARKNAPPEATYRLSEDGDERPLGDILAELDRERDAIEVLRECLK